MKEGGRKSEVAEQDDRGGEHHADEEGEKVDHRQKRMALTMYPSRKPMQNRVREVIDRSLPVPMMPRKCGNLLPLAHARDRGLVIEDVGVDRPHVGCRHLDALPHGLQLLLVDPADGGTLRDLVLLGPFGEGDLHHDDWGERKPSEYTRHARQCKQQKKPPHWRGRISRLLLGREVRIGRPTLADVLLGSTQERGGVARLQDLQVAVVGGLEVFAFVVGVDRA